MGNDGDTANHESTTLRPPLSSSSYWSVLVNNRQYRWYLAAHFCQRLGETFVRIANLVAVQDLSGKGTALALLATYSLLPKVIFSQLGGWMADRFDRRRLMVLLDAIASVVSLLFLVALQRESLPLLFAATLLRSTVYSTYLPIGTSILPSLLLAQKEDLPTAVTMNNWVYSGTTFLGGVMAGTAAADIGLDLCYLLDSVTYVLSAIFIYCISSTYYARTNDVRTRGTMAPAGGPTTDCEEDFDDDEQDTTAALTRTRLCSCCRNKNSCTAYVSLDPVKKISSHLSSCGFGWLVLLDGSAALVWGPEDILGASLSTVEGNETLTRYRLGLTVTVVGLGLLTGPTLTNHCISSQKHPAALQATCIWGGIGVMTLGWMAIAVAATYGHYGAFLVGTFIRTLGSGTIWVGSSLLLQLLTEPQFLGRILALAATGETILEALSAMISGQLKDKGGSQNSNATLAWFGAAMGVLVVTIWTIFHLRGGGAAQERFRVTYEAAPTFISEVEVSSQSDRILCDRKLREKCVVEENKDIVNNPSPLPELT